MKKFLLPMLLAFMCFVVVAQEVTINFDYPQVVKQGEYIKLVYPNCYDVAAPGNPLIPAYQYNFLEKQDVVSDGVKVKSIEFYDDIVEGRLLPEAKPQPLSKINAEVDRTENADVYNSKSAFPAANAMGSSTQFLRGHGITSVIVYPAVFYPSENIVKCVKSITFENITSYSKSELPAFGDENTIRRINDIANHKDALSSYQYSATKEDDFDILVVTSEALLPSFEPYISYKIKQGYNVAVEVVEDIYSNYDGSDNQEMIRNCVKYYYNRYGIEYVMLVGDADVATEEHNIIPCRGFAAGDDPSIPADMYYANLDGTWNDNNNSLFGEPGETDFYAEVSIGRICADSPEEVTNAVTKMIRYQSSPVVEDVEKAMMVGENLNSQNVTWGGTYKDEIANGTTRHGFATGGIPSNISVRKLYERDTNWVSPDLYDIYSEDGMHVINHLGHSNVDYNMKLSASAVTTGHFSNDGINRSLVIQYTQGCYAGSFDNRGEGHSAYGTTDCITEKFTTIETAHVAQVANSRYGWYMPGNTNSSSQFYDRLFFDGMYNKGYEKLGDANRYSKELYTSWLEDYWSGDNYRYVVYELTLFGDPSMAVWTQKPEPLMVEMMCSVPHTLTEWPIETNTPNALITIVKDNQLLYKGEMNEEGNCIVDFQTLNLVAGDTVCVTVMGKNMIPYEKMVNVVDLTSVIDLDVTFSDELGNNDGVINHGETIEMSFTAKNISTIPYTTEEILLECDADFITFDSENIAVDVIQPGETYSSPVYTFTVDANNAQSGFVTIGFISDENVKYETYIEVFTPKIVMTSSEVVEKGGNNDGFIQQGEVGLLKVSYTNTGDYPLNNVTIEMSKNDIVVSYLKDVVEIDTIMPNETVECEFEFVVGECIDGFIIIMEPQVKDEMNFTFDSRICYIIGDSKILLIDLDKNKNSFNKLGNDLRNFIGANVEYVTKMPTQQKLNEYTIVFVSLGVFNENTALEQEQQELLINYLQQGGYLYLESGSMWYNDEDFGLKEYFGIVGEPTEESWINGFTDVVGVEGTDFANVRMSYNGDNKRIDCVKPAENSSAVQIMVNSPFEFGGAVLNSTEDYITIGASFEYGGLEGNDNNGVSLYMQQVLNTFGINLIGPKEILFPADTTVCMGDSIVLDAGEGFVSYLWSNGEIGRYMTFSTDDCFVDTYTISVEAVDEIGYISSSLVNIHVEECTGIEEVVENKNIVLYPNPTGGVFTVSMEKLDSAEVVIFDLTGNCVHKSTVSDGGQINISHLRNGVYFVEINDNNNVIIRKLIKQ